MCVDAPPCVTLWHLVGYFGIPECPLRPTWCQIWYFWHQRHNIMMSAWLRNGCNWLALRSHNIRQQRIAFICVWWFVCDINVTFLSFWSIKRIHMTRNQIILTKQSGRVPKNLTASRILQILIALCQIKAKIHSFPTMYIIGGGKFGLTRWKKCLKPKRSPKNSCFGGNESQLHNFGRVWDPNFLRWPQFGGCPRKATCLSFKMSYVQGP